MWNSQPLHYSQFAHTASESAYPHLYPDHAWPFLGRNRDDENIYTIGNALSRGFAGTGASSVAYNRDGSLSFGNNEAYLDGGTRPVLKKNQPATVLFWNKLTSFGSTSEYYSQGCFAVEGVSTNPLYIVLTDNTGYGPLAWGIYRTLFSGSFVDDGNQIADNVDVIRQYAIVMPEGPTKDHADEDRDYGYIDTYGAQSSAGAGWADISSTIHKIGRHANNNPRCDMYEMRVYNRALTRSEILESYSLGPNGVYAARNSTVFNVPAVAPGGLSIPIAAYHYNHHLGTMS